MKLKKIGKSIVMLLIIIPVSSLITVNAQELKAGRDPVMLQRQQMEQKEQEQKAQEQKRAEQTAQEQKAQEQKTQDRLRTRDQTMVKTRSGWADRQGKEPMLPAVSHKQPREGKGGHSRGAPVPSRQRRSRVQGPTGARQKEPVRHLLRGLPARGFQRGQAGRQAPGAPAEGKFTSSDYHETREATPIYDCLHPGGADADTSQHCSIKPGKCFHTPCRSKRLCCRKQAELIICRQWLWQ